MEFIEARTFAHPIDFPLPTIGVGEIKRFNDTLDGLVFSRTVLQVAPLGTDMTTEYYEIGGVFKKAIYGQVHFGHMLSLKDGVLKRTRKCAIKIFSKVRIHELRGTTQENPFKEIAAQQYIGYNSNITGSFNCCHDINNIYLVMEFVGPDLCDNIMHEVKPSMAVVKDYFSQILNGIDHLHKKGVAHRDLSLENVLLSSDGVCKIIDFGMALRLPSCETVGSPSSINGTALSSSSSAPSSSVLKIPPQGICGKQHYISPEVLQNQQAFDALASDVWALGVMLFIMLTGFPPLEAALPADPRYSFVRDGKLRLLLEQWDINLDDDVLDLMSRLLRIDPKERLTVEEIRQHPWLQKKLVAKEVVDTRLAVAQPRHCVCGQDAADRYVLQGILCEQHQSMLLNICNYYSLPSPTA